MHDSDRLVARIDYKYFQKMRWQIVAFAQVVYGLPNRPEWRHSDEFGLCKTPGAVFD